jgi:uncharacterized protein (DUF983 family)
MRDGGDRRLLAPCPAGGCIPERPDAALGGGGGFSLPGCERTPIVQRNMNDTPNVAEPVRWSPDRDAAPGAKPETPMGAALWRGINNRCPNCAAAPVFAGYLRVVPECAACGFPLGKLRSDDLPPYVTIFLVGHLLLPLALWVERDHQPPMWVHMAVWLPLLTLACIGLLRPVKGGVVGLMYRLGFGRD